MKGRGHCPRRGVALSGSARDLSWLHRGRRAPGRKHTPLAPVLGSPPDQGPLGSPPSAREPRAQPPCPHLGAATPRAPQKVGGSGARPQGVWGGLLPLTLSGTLIRCSADGEQRLRQGVRGQAGQRSSWQARSLCAPGRSHESPVTASPFTEAPLVCVGLKRVGPWAGAFTRGSCQSETRRPAPPALGPH